MATNQKEKVNESVEIEEVEISTIGTNIDEPQHIDTAKVVEEDTDMYKDIDAVCEIVNAAKKERNDEKEQRLRDEEKKRERQAYSAMATQKAENEKARQAEETRKINEGRYIRKKMKRKATAMLFCLCIMSAVFGYVVAGILIHIIFNPKVWIFVGVMGIFGMVNTLIHTYLYRYIREEIYRK